MPSKAGVAPSCLFPRLPHTLRLCLLQACYCTSKVYFLVTLGFQPSTSTPSFFPGIHLQTDAAYSHGTDASAVLKVARCGETTPSPSRSTRLATSHSSTPTKKKGALAPDPVAKKRCVFRSSPRTQDAVCWLRRQRAARIHTPAVTITIDESSNKTREQKPRANGREQSSLCEPPYVASHR
jgi:hypothetical protein